MYVAGRANNWFTLKAHVLLLASLSFDFPDLMF